MAAPIISIEKLNHNYKESQALNDINLVIPAGKMVTIVGPDAVGKSSLMSIIAGARKIQTGTVTVMQGDISQRQHCKRISRKIAYMPQGLGKNLFQELTVRENIDFFGRLFNKPNNQRKARIELLLNVANLTKFQDRPAGKLSGGMKQKLGLCCALLHDPQLLILDEPTTGVDPVSRQQFWQLIEALRKINPQMSVLVSTAYMDEAEDFDWVIAMLQGRVLATGSPGQIMQQTAQTSLEDAFTTLMQGSISEHDLNTAPIKTKPAKDRLANHHTDIAIKARNLTRRFGDFVAVKDVSFDIRRGEIFGFLGSNGCGKTTTMKMLTGLLAPSQGTASLFNEPLEGKQFAARQRVGYMSQGFSLYGELTVNQNLRLHARLYHLPEPHASHRISKLIQRFELSHFIDMQAAELPLGIKQRLSLAIAIIHEPDVLILDEPTSGVDPIAREQFWDALVTLSRNDGVTIFISTHFMSEALRCDRVSLMHAGSVLVSDTPENLIEQSNSKDFEAAAIKFIQDAMPEEERDFSDQLHGLIQETTVQANTQEPRFYSLLNQSWQRLWAHSIRETQEIRRDPVRLAFALLGTVIMLFIITYGMITDTDDIRFSVLDLDQTPQSRAYISNLGGSNYFIQQSPVYSYHELRNLLIAREIDLAIEIAPGFGKRLTSGHQPNEVLVTVDGANPSQAASIESYIISAHNEMMAMLIPGKASPYQQLITPRFRYNPSLEAINAMAPAMPALLLMLFPALLGAISVVKEKEIGTITNFYVTPATRLEFLVGKQLPYLLIGFINFLILLVSIIYPMDVAMKGSLLMVCVSAFVYLIVATNYGLFTSTFSKSQTGAIFVTAILSILPTVSFSGLSQPVSTLTGGAQMVGKFWPTTYFMNISVGSFTKGTGPINLMEDLLLLSLFIPVFLGFAMLFLKKQET